MSIFKGNSIYKTGAGGGGYKDGGQLIDGDFIKVDNNTVSSYDNESRDPVNFYFDYKDGEIFNSIIEFTTQVNSNVYVYVVKNGLYYLLGNVGGNSVNAGADYKINIIGNSYTVEQVTGGGVPKYDVLNGIITPIYQVKDNLFITADLGIDLKNVALSKQTNGWHLAKNSELNTFQNEFNSDRPAYCAVSGWNGTPGTNTTGIGLKPDGYTQLDGGQYWNVYQKGNWAMFFIENSYNIPYYTPTGGGSFYSEPTKLNIRLFKEIDI